MRNFFAYIIRCVNGKYYVGHSRNVVKRFERHLEKTGSRFTLQNKPEKVVWSQAFETEAEAVRRENQIKGWCREKKEKLIDRIWK